jgi:hypothetical protein
MRGFQPVAETEALTVLLIGALGQQVFTLDHPSNATLI